MVNLKTEYIMAKIDNLYMILNIHITFTVNTRFRLLTSIVDRLCVALSIKDHELKEIVNYNRKH